MAGDSDSAIITGGTDTPSPGKLANTESWNGSSWTEVADLATARRESGMGGSSTVAVLFGGEAPTTGATEEWTTAATVTKTFTVS